MNADAIVLRAQRVAILGQFLETIADQKQRLEFIQKLRGSKAISPLAADMLCETYVQAINA